MKAQKNVNYDKKNLHQEKKVKKAIKNGII